MANHRLGPYYYLAKEQGCRSRSYFKLTQLDDHYSFLPDARAVLDLCAAPGSWLQAAVQRVPDGSFVVGVDLLPIRPVPGAIAVQEDIAHPNCREIIRNLLVENHVAAFDLVLHDGSPNIGGDWAQETTSQNSLVINSLMLAAQFLAPNGTFVTKVFRSQDYNKVLSCLRQLFEEVEATKPDASRATSAETFIVCQKYKAPAKIDLEKVFDVLRVSKKRVSKKKRKRCGYLGILYSKRQKRRKPKDERTTHEDIQLIRECWRLIHDTGWSVTTSLVPRRLNKVADALAQEAFLHELKLVVFENLPTAISLLVNLDVTNFVRLSQ